MTSLLQQQKLLKEGNASKEELFADCLEKTQDDVDYLAWQWVYESYAHAMEGRWQSSGQNRPLEGLMIGVKDIYNSQTGTTEMGSAAWANHHAGNDARVLAEFIYQGATMVGKTTTAEFAVHSLPQTLNPWDVTKTPGTSSSGSAVAVALGHVPLALATQTGGSITRPASFTGTIGFKPSQGIFPRTGILKTCDPFDTIGFICRHIEDIRPAFEATRVRGTNYPFTKTGLDAANVHSKNAKKLNIAKVVTPFTKYEARDISSQVDRFLESLPSNKFNITELNLSAVLADADYMHQTIYDKALSYYFKTEREADAKFSDIMREIFARGDQTSPEHYRELLERLPHLRSNFFKATTDVDLICVASTASTAPLRDELELPDSSRYWSTMHLPTLSLPLFMNDDSKMPFGVQLVGTRKFYEPLLFRFIEDAGLDSSALRTYR